MRHMLKRGKRGFWLKRTNIPSRGGYMNLRNRILTSIFILLFIPLVLGVGGAFIIINYQDFAIEQEYGVEDGSVKSITNPLRILEKLAGNYFEEVLEVIEEEPDKFADAQFLDELNESMKNAHSFLVVRTEEEYTYIGDKEIFERIDQPIPSYGKYIENSPSYYLGGRFPCLYKQKDFEMSDGTKASAIIVTNLNKVIPQIKFMAIQVLVTLICIILFTAVILILWIYKSMLRPLNGLSRASKRIRDGELNFSIKDETTDEIGTLCEDFEQMRIKLKEYIDKQQLYENNSREMISNISHDLKTPLTAIKGYTEGLIDGVADTREKQEKYLKTIYSKANDMTLLVDELSLYSKIDCDSMPYNFKELSVEDYFADCMEEIALDTEVKGVRVSFFNYLNPGVKVIADPEQVKRVIGNIVSNSLKYIQKEKGIINIRLYEEDKGIRVEIEDNGKGIAKQDLPYVFDRFYRTDASRNSSAKGTGLGLAIAKKIIEDHEGQIWIKSKENVGTTVFFTLKSDFNSIEAEVEKKKRQGKKYGEKRRRNFVSKKAKIKNIRPDKTMKAKRMVDKNE